MSPNKFSSLVLVGALLPTMSSCAPYQEPFWVVQFCIQNDRDFVATFPSKIASVAREYSLTIVDHSAQTERLFNYDKPSTNENRPVGQTINIGLFRGVRVKAMIGNLGLSRHEVLISFFGDSTDKTDGDLSVAVVGALKQRWPVETVPVGTGAFPLESCKSGTKAD
ncbi:MAG: hypothetical protein K2Q06_09855 [Parvularculaceae bacterium]|nr:hypothetical protein [Parvularculaceae bacterium]